MAASKKQVERHIEGHVELNVPTQRQNQINPTEMFKITQ